MTKILNNKYLILNTITRAYESLRVLLDPAATGNPYEIDLPIRTKKFNKNNQIYHFQRRRFSWNRFQ